MKDSEVNDIMRVVMSKALPLMPRIGLDEAEMEAYMRARHPEWFGEPMSNDLGKVMTNDKTPACPKCGSHRVVPFPRGIQEGDALLCTDCRHSWEPGSTAAPQAHLHK